MTIWDALITELFGCQPGYPLNTKACPPGQGFHNGVDYGCAVGTDITVNGVVIGKSGATGTVTGPHCHVGHWNNMGVVTIKPQEGKNVSGAVVSQVSEDATNGKFVRVADADGSSWVYLHMSQQLVSVGQKLDGKEEIMEPADYRANSGDVQNYFKNFLKRDATADDHKVYDGKPQKEVVYAIIGSDEFKNLPTTGNFKPYSGKPLFEEN